jgi:tetratricopeptide (TPR) repeat protein
MKVRRLGEPFAIALCLSSVLLCACSRTSKAPPISGGSPTNAPPAPDTPAREVTLPDLAAVAAPVQQQIRTRFDAATSSAPGMPAADRAARYGDLGSVLAAATFFDQSVLSFEHAEALAPDDMRWPYLRAHALVRKGDREDAVHAFERAAALQPSYVPALVWLGDMYLDLGQPDRARSAFARALEHQPTSAAALFGAGRAALVQGAYADAVRQMEQALAADPRATAIRYPLAMAYRGVGQTQRADALLGQRGMVAPTLDDPVLEQATVRLDSAMSHESAGMEAIRRQDWSGAVADFRRGLEIAPDDPSLRYWMASAMIAGGDAAGAEREFRAVAAAHPDYAKAHFSLGAILDRQGHHDEARREYEAAVRTDPTMVDARVRLGDALRTVHQLAPAMEQYRAAVELDPNAVAAWLGGARTLIDLGARDEARDWIARGKRLHPQRTEWATIESGL